ncbi:MAG: hypothetical protein EXR51_11635 [Dehalococcoidia bacterium]|nr:hypothetical protein [Dehalococcoidia bacterium]
MSDVDENVARIESGEAWDDSDEVVRLEMKPSLDKVVPVRLSSAMWLELRQEAMDLGVGPSTLARMWILEKLRRSERPRTATSGRRG